MLGQREVVSRIFRLPGISRLSPASHSVGSSRTNAVSGSGRRNTEHSQCVWHGRCSGKEMEQLRASSGDLEFAVMC